MNPKSFLHKSHFKIYDAIIPLFRLVSVLILIGFTLYSNGISHLEWRYSFVVAYLGYALLLLFSRPLRELIVLKHPYVIGICETLIITYGVASTGGADSPLYFSYIMVISFFVMIYPLRFSLAITTFCGLSYLLGVFMVGEPFDMTLIYKFLYLYAFAIFLGTINDRIKKYHIKLALYDELTALHNRQFFLGEFEHLHDQSRKGGKPFSLVVIDVNDFKKINDTKGHLAGDEVLRNLGHLIEQNVRKGDISARYGGDEFVILLPSTTREEAEDIMKRLHENIALSLQDGVSVSVGIACYPEDGSYRDDLFHHADMAMYAAKQSRTQVSV